MKDDINFAHERVRLFAEHQKESIKSLKRCRRGFGPGKS